jgi:hypothetical protein
MFNMLEISLLQIHIVRCRGGIDDMDPGITCSEL